MSMCAFCGLVMRDAEVCPIHLVVNHDMWASGNRAACDFFHRGIVREATMADRKYWVEALNWRP